MTLPHFLTSPNFLESKQPLPCTHCNHLPSELSLFEKYVYILLLYFYQVIFDSSSLLYVNQTNISSMIDMFYHNIKKKSNVVFRRSRGPLLAFKIMNYHSFLMSMKKLHSWFQNASAEH